MTKRKPRKRARRKDPFANRIDEVTAWDAEDEVTPAAFVEETLTPVPVETDDSDEDEEDEAGYASFLADEFE